MSVKGESWLALDVGGANLKGADSAGVMRSRPFALWRRPDQLVAELAALAESFSPCTRVAMTMTAELCDCFETKRAGVRFVLDACAAALPGLPLRVWGLDGAFHDPAEIRENPALAAAANWLALATIAAESGASGRGVLIDIGSTTTDLIPLENGRAVPDGRTDTQRLQSGELIYIGTRRTPLCALAPTLRFRGVPTGLAAEVFATTLDVFLTLGDISEDRGDCDTADGRPATRLLARDRLARMVGADREGFSEDDARAFALEARHAIIDRICGSSVNSNDSRLSWAVVAGSGEFLARAVAERLRIAEERITSLSARWGPTASAAACAQALLVLAAREV